MFGGLGRFCELILKGAFPELKMQVDVPGPDIDFTFCTLFGIK